MLNVHYERRNKGAQYLYHYKLVKDLIDSVAIKPIIYKTDCTAIMISPSLNIEYVCGISFPQWGVLALALEWFDSKMKIERLLSNFLFCASLSFAFILCAARSLFSDDVCAVFAGN